MNEFKDRLRDYRAQLGIATQTEMAERIGITRQLYSNLENGKSPSKNVINKLVSDSNMPAEYWVYGVTTEKYINERQEFKCLYTMLDRLIDTDLLNLKDGDWSPEVKEMLLSALRADITHMLLKKKKEN
ncbi:helix-turn-helix transcriptional regulator [Fusobacterium varium]